jgi:hypothetical protein
VENSQALDEEHGLQSLKFQISNPILTARRILSIYLVTLMKCLLLFRIVDLSDGSKDGSICVGPYYIVIPSRTEEETALHKFGKHETKI